MTTLFVDCKYGISGDMTLSSLVDLGADPQYIERELKKLPIDDFSMSFEDKNDHDILCKHLHLEFANQREEHHHHEGHHHNHHSASEILDLITQSELPERVKQRSRALFMEVARAEGKVHGVPFEVVHFHEVGAMDSIIDMIGVCLGLESLDVDEVVFSKVPTGSGMISIAHGLYPVPAPATAEILVGVPLSDFTYEAELTTPTGAAFAKVLASKYADAPRGQIEKIGYGSGTKEFSHPNVLRTMLLQVCSSPRDAAAKKKQAIEVLQCQIDDMTGEELGFLLQCLMDFPEVLDAYYTQLIMKKNRPGVLLTVLAKEEARETIEEFLLVHSSSFGVRTYLVERNILDREFYEYETQWGIIHLKAGSKNGHVLKITPEYDDIIEIVEQSGETFSTIYSLAEMYGQKLLKGLNGDEG